MTINEVENKKVRIVQTDGISQKNPSNYNQDTIIVDRQGGVYLGNGSSNPTIIANLSTIDNTSYLPLTGGTISGALTTNNFLKITAPASDGTPTRNAVIIRSEAVSSNLNQSLVHIGSNYGYISVNESDVAKPSAHIDAIGIYRGVIGVGGTFTYDTLKSNQSNNISLEAVGNVKATTFIGNLRDYASTSKIIVGASATAKANESATNGYVRLNHIDYYNDTSTTTVTSSHLIKGTGTVTVTSDSNGNITINGTDTNTDTHYTSKNVVCSTSTGTSNGAASDGAVRINHIENNGVTSSHLIDGSGSVTVTSDSNGNITINGTDTNTDTKVTSADNHYTPTGDSSVTATASGSVSWSGAVVTGLTKDSKGHITGITTSTIPSNPNTHYQTGITAGATSTVTNSSATNPYIKIKDDSTHRSQIQLKGGGLISVSSDDNGVITISSSGDNWVPQTNTISNLNSITNGKGIWGWINANSTNKPEGITSGGEVLSFTLNNGHTLQFASHYKGNGIYTRNRNADKVNTSEEWSEWKKLAFAEDIPTVTDYQTTKEGHYTPSDKDSSVTATASGSVSWSGAVVTGVTKDSKGHIIGVTTSTIPSNPNVDTKVTVNTSTGTVYLVGQSGITNGTNSTLYKNSSVYMSNGSITAYSFFETSDERLKTFTDDIDIDLNKLSDLRKSYFTFNSDESNKSHIGISAQEVQKLYPEIVNTNEDGYLSVDYSKLSVIALKAVDKLYKKNIELEDRLAKIEFVLRDKELI